MPAPSGQEAPVRRSFAFPLLISIALHALLTLLFCAVSTRCQDETSRIVDTAVGDTSHPITLHLVGFAAAPSGPRQPSEGPVAKKGGEEQEFHVVVLPTPALVDGPPVAEPLVLPPPSSVGGRGTGSASREDGNGGSGPSGFLRADGAVRSVVYVIDCSMSMGGPDERCHKFALARRELLDSLRRVPEGTHFQVIPYNHQAEPLRIDGQIGFVSRSDGNLQATADALEKRKPAGWTDHGQALRRGLTLRPEILFFVTDGDDLKLAQERDATAFNKGRTVIHVVELSWRPSPPDCPLRALARNNRGTYRHVPVRR
jgi:hypothetical protein